MVFIGGHAGVNISVHLYVHHGNALGLKLPDDLQDRAFGIALGVGQGFLFAVFQNTGAVGDADVLQQGDAGRQVLGGNVLLAVAVAGDVGNDQRAEDDDHDDSERGDRHGALTQTDHGVPEEANGLGLELFVVDLLALDHLEIRFRQIDKLLRERFFQVNHYLVPPTLIRGSMMP